MVQIIGKVYPYGDFNFECSYIHDLIFCYNFSIQWNVLYKANWLFVNLKITYCLTRKPFEILTLKFHLAN